MASVTAMNVAHAPSMDSMRTSLRPPKDHYVAVSADTLRMCTTLVTRRNRSPATDESPGHRRLPGDVVNDG